MYIKNQWLQQKIVGATGIQREEIRRISSLGKYQAFSAFLPLLITPLLSHFYSPPIFANGSLAIYLITILSMAVTLRLEGAILIISKENIVNLEVWKLAKSVLKLCSGLSLITYLILIFVDWGLYSGNLLENHIVLLTFSTISVFFSGFSAVQIALDTRMGLTTKIGSVTLYRSIFLVTAQILFGYLFGSPQAMVAAYALSFLPSLMRLKTIFRYQRWPEPTNIKKHLMGHKNFPKFQLPAAVLNAGIPFGQTTFVYWLYGSSHSGQFALGLRLIVAPALIVSSTLNSVFLGRIADEKTDLPKLRKSTSTYLKLLGILGVIFLASIPALIQLSSSVLGPKWAGSESILFMMTLLVPSSLLLSILNSLSMMLGKQIWVLIWSAIILLVPNIVLALAKVLGLTALSGIALLGTTSVVLVMIYLLFIYRRGLRENP